MSNPTTGLPEFFRLPAPDIQNIGLRPGAVYLSTDTETIAIDADDTRISLSPVRSISNEEQLSGASPAYIYVSESGDLYIQSAGKWHKYIPDESKIKTMLYRFTVAERVDSLSFSASAMAVEGQPEFDILTEDSTNITGSDFITRRWSDEDTYTVSYAGGWPVGTYYLKLSFGGKAASTDASDIEVSTSAEYFAGMSVTDALQQIGRMLEVLTAQVTQK